MALIVMLSAFAGTTQTYSPGLVKERPETQALGVGVPPTRPAAGSAAPADAAGCGVPAGKQNPLTQTSVETGVADMAATGVGDRFVVAEGAIVGITRAVAVRNGVEVSAFWAPTIPPPGPVLPKAMIASSSAIAAPT